MIEPNRLKEIGFLRNLNEQHVEQVAEIARLEDYQEGTVLFHQGQACPYIHFILSGEIALQVEESGGNSVEVARLGRGELLGWSPVLGHGAMTATARGIAPGQVAVLDVNAVHELSERDPRFGLAFLREIALIISERLWSARQNLARMQRHRPMLSAQPEGSD